MARKIDIDDLAKEINEVMKDFVGTTEEAVEEAIETTSKSALQELRNAHPPGSGEYGSWNEYNKSWKITKTKRDKKNHNATIHNVKHYRLTHLLEKGHALVGGGRTRAFPHIAPVAEKAEKELIENIKKGI